MGATPQPARRPARAAPAGADALDPRFARLGVGGRDDLPLHLPLRYEDETRLTAIAALVDGDAAQVEGTVLAAEVIGRGRRTLQVRLGDGSGELTLRFLHFYPSQVAQLANGRRIRAFGEVRAGLLGIEMVHPRYRLVTETTPLPDRLTPVYPTTAGLTQFVLRKEVLAALDAARWEDTIPADLLTAAGLAELPALMPALRAIHCPAPGDDLVALTERRTPACRRVILEELLAQQLSLRLARAARAARPGIPLPASGPVDALIAALPFALTAAQQRVWREISADLATAQPMNRLLQGDVGSGKTVIAALAALQAIGSGGQAALMAPTEILAEQHRQKLAPWLEGRDLAGRSLRLGWLAGSLTAAAKRKVKAAVAAGEIDLLIGTHALIEDSVVFDRLALAIVDEQHRFGVAQRLALRTRADGLLPHQLMMSATPIPRTLAMTFYADLDVSVIDQLPPGRQPVTTKLISDRRRDEVVERIRVAVAQGRQVYWVCPLIEESEALDLQDALATFERLTAELAGIRVGLVHGRLAADEKARVMAGFKAGSIDVLVATTVIEVGVDVPNASLMVIEHAERFGLSQLHQLRGRVGRGAAASVCVLLYRHPAGAAARSRLTTMYQFADGFEIARRDLALRGPGDFLGARQSGAMLLRFADLERDADLVEAARTIAEAMLAHHPDAVAAHLARWLAGREDYLRA
ncbi:MAG: ATP-dependent DNA helicase RecG [Lautropia sp.]